MRTTENESHFKDLDKMPTEAILEGINSEDRSVPEAVGRCIPQITLLVDAIVERGGRVFYMGAGTSGRLGIVDASEILPTYGVKGKFIGIIAGGDTAIRTAVEGAEDDAERGWKDLLAFNPTPSDTLVGISASGGAPYILGAIKGARKAGMLTSCITCNDGAKAADICDIPIVAVVGPEFVTGSTRMKSGTASKLILNMISTAVMIRLGHVKGNKMVDMQLSNQKLVDRGTRMIMSEAGLADYDTARDLLLRYGSVRSAVQAFAENSQPHQF